MVLGDFQLVKHSIRLPPPVVFGLGELCLPVVSVQVGMECIVALSQQRPKDGGTMKAKAIR